LFYDLHTLFHCGTFHSNDFFDGKTQYIKQMKVELLAVVCTNQPHPSKADSGHFCLSSRTPGSLFETVFFSPQHIMEDNLMA
jgi:hypothetical protein